MPRRVPALALTALLTTGGASALAQEAGGFVVRGMGALGCERLVGGLQGEQGSDAAARLVAWLSGYVSHANRAAAEIDDVLPYSNIDGLATVVARVCANNPEARTDTVTASVLATLDPLAVRSQDDVVTVERAGSRLAIRPSVLEGVQTRLIARDLLPPGGADGVYGEETATALARFQQEAGIDATGLPDAWTVFVLMLDRQRE